jgi:predicted lactoylglutathione lyase
MEMDSFIAWTSNPESPGLCLTKAYDGKPATVGNGVMVALQADSPEDVDSMHAAALSLGASDEGAPGPRGDNFYAGYFRDLDGNKLNFFCIPGEK